MEDADYLAFRSVAQPTVPPEFVQIDRWRLPNGEELWVYQRV